MYINKYIHIFRIYQTCGIAILNFLHTKHEMQRLYMKTDTYDFFLLVRAATPRVTLREIKKNLGNLIYTHTGNCCAAILKQIEFYINRINLDI